MELTVRVRYLRAMINVTKSFLPPLQEYEQQLKRVWQNEWLTNRGELVLELEQKLKQRLRVDNLLFVNNGTVAIQIAIKALGLTKEVITTPFSYVATTSSLVWENCEPVFADIDPHTLTIDPRQIEASITPRTEAILATHVYGYPCDVEAIQDIATRHNLKVIYDAAHCFGATYKGRSLVSYGDVSTSSFHATKLFHTGEGGAVVTNAPGLADKVYWMHNFGHNGPEAFWGLGINGKSSELHAAMGLTVLPYIDKLVELRKAVSERYDEALSGLPIKRPTVHQDLQYNYAYYPVIFDSEATLLKVRDAMNAQQVFPRRYFYPSLSTLSYVKTKSTPVANDIASRVLCLPLYHDLSESDVSRIASILKQAL